MNDADETKVHDLEDDMPTSRALRRRGRHYTEHAVALMAGRSGLSQDEKLELLNHASEFLDLAKADVSAAIDAVKAEAEAIPAGE